MFLPVNGMHKSMHGDGGNATASLTPHKLTEVGYIVTVRQSRSNEYIGFSFLGQSARHQARRHRKTKISSYICSPGFGITRNRPSAFLIFVVMEYSLDRYLAIHDILASSDTKQMADGGGD